MAVTLAKEIEIVADGLMKMEEAKAFSGFSRAYLYDLMARGELPYVSIGRTRRIPRRALVELAANHLQGGGGQVAR